MERIQARSIEEGSADCETIEAFEKNLANNLYKIWNRMASGTYFPPPVLAVEIPKSNGGTRVLGIPAVSDRIAQMVVHSHLAPLVEPHFDTDSYGYRPGKSALDAVATCRQRCWKLDWVVDLDVKGFFDNLDHDLIMRAVRRFTSCRWILLYIERWLKAPTQMPDGNLVARTKGVPQGGVISPLLANIFLHLAFDRWMRDEHPDVLFERYADDIVVHCRTEGRAQSVLQQIEDRLRRCRLELHPEKTQVVYCKQESRPKTYPRIKFDFLGYTFRPRMARGSRGLFVSFGPAVSSKAAQRIRQTIKSWALPRRSGSDLERIASEINPVVRGWIAYYGRFNRTVLRNVLKHLDDRLKSWAKRKFKKFKRSRRKAAHWLGGVAHRQPELLAHWEALGPAARNGWTIGAV